MLLGVSAWFSVTECAALAAEYECHATHYNVNSADFWQQLAACSPANGLCGVIFVWRALEY